MCEIVLRGSDRDNIPWASNVHDSGQACHGKCEGESTGHIPLHASLLEKVCGQCSNSSTYLGVKYKTSICI